MANKYVSTSGSNANAGTEAFPYLTIGKALPNVTGGDIIFVGTGIFTGADTTATISGGPNAYITIRGQGKGVTLSKTSQYIFNKPYYKIENITFSGGGQAPVVFYSGNSIVSGCEFTRALRGIWLDNSNSPAGINNVTITDCDFHHWFSTNGCIDAAGSGHLVKNNHFYKNGGYDLIRCNGLNNTIISNNFIDGTREPTNQVATAPEGYTISTGLKTFTIGTGYGFEAGFYMEIYSGNNSATNYMRGGVDNYVTGVLYVNVSSINGSATITGWTVREESNNNHGDIVQAFTTSSYNNLFERNLITGTNHQLGNFESNGNTNLRDWTFRNNIFYKARTQINIYASGFKFFNNTVYGVDVDSANGFRDASDTVKGTGRSTVINNMFVRVSGSASAGNGAYNCSSGFASYNLLTDYLDGPFTALPNAPTGTINGGYTPDQLFVDYANGNLKLISTSPAATGGTDLSAYGFNTDYDGNIRNGIWSMGAYQFFLTSGGSYIAISRLGRHPKFRAFHRF